MSDGPEQPLVPVSLESIFEALPIGIAFVDAGKRIMMMNAAFHRSLDLPPNGIPPGTPVEQAVRASALRGVYGPGDPEAQVAAVMAPDRTQTGRLRRRTFQGRSFDLYNTPLPDGGYIVSAIETTALIAARTEAEGALAQTTTALATLRVGLAAFRANGTLLFSNPRFAELFGIPSDRIIPGLSVQALLERLEAHDEFAGADGRAFLDAQRRADRTVPSAMRRILASGQVVDVVSDPLPDGGWTITVADISRLAQAENEARRRAQLLDSILDAVPHGICVYGADRRVSLFNPTYTRVMAGAPVAVGDHMDDIVRRRAESGEFGAGNAATIFAQQMAYDTARPQIRRRRRPDGTAIDVRTAPLPDGGHISVVTDVTALTQAEDELSRRAGEMAVMLASIPHGVLLWGADRRLIASNAIAADLLGHPPGLLTPGRTDMELLAHMVARREWGEQSEAVAEGLLTRDRGISLAGQFVRANGRVLDMRSDPTPGGGWVTTYTDVTYIRESEEALRRAKEAAEAANQAKSRFLATMSHELRTPLNAVIGFSEALLRQKAAPNPADVAEFAQQINDSGRQLLAQINIVLDVARIESGRFELASDKVDLARLFRTVLRQAQALVHNPSVVVDFDIQQPLPLLLCDERRMQQALVQVLTNAIKFSDRTGKVAVNVAVAPNGELAITITDTGIGMHPDELDRVFEPFIQLDSSLSRRYQGAGLGLYIAKAMVVGHGGTIALRSTPGAGTTAEIRLPPDRLQH